MYKQIEMSILFCKYRLSAMKVITPVLDKYKLHGCFICRWKYGIIIRENKYLQPTEDAIL